MKQKTKFYAYTCKGCGAPGNYSLTEEEDNARCVHGTKTLGERMADGCKDGTLLCPACLDGGLAIVLGLDELPPELQGRWLL